jgi:probable F420-dependent oxidoreductase
MAFAPVEHYAPLASAVEQAGFHGMLLADHLVSVRRPASRYPYSADGSPPWEAETPFPDAWVTIGALAASTTALRFGTSVYVAPARDVLTVAKLVGTAAVLSGDRVTFGVGAGWMKDEFDLTGQSFKGRGERLDEMIDVLRLLWSGDWVEHDGRHYTLPGVRMRPAPGAPVPLWAGGYSERALRRAATRCDGWVGVASSVKQATDVITRLRRMLDERGRDPRSFDITFSVPEAIDARAVAAWQDRGVTGLIARPWADWTQLQAGSPMMRVQQDVPLSYKIEAAARFGNEVARQS